MHIICPLKIRVVRDETVRSSLKSSVTVSHEVAYRNLDNNRPAANLSTAAAFISCGGG